ncbi:MAG: HlyD family efflux transporter periplasmic adaptor subunit [Planctomycetota bacterium]
MLVCSPMEGNVISWRPEDYLAGRPVRRGQRLLEIADDQQWRIELEVPDHRTGHVLRASQAGGPLAVEYVVRADPSENHTGTVSSIAETTHVTAEGVPVVRVVVTPNDAMPANPRSGLGVSAKINCGEHSLAYVWLHEAIEAIQRRWF